MTPKAARRRGALIGAGILALAVLPRLLAQPWWVLIAGLVLCLAAAAIAVEDLARMIIPDRYTVMIALVALLLRLEATADPWAVGVSFAEGLAVGTGMAAISFAYAQLRGRSGIGFGDVKLLGASAMLVGVWGIGLQLLLASTAAALFVIIRSWRKGRPLRAVARVPFGAFLAPSAVIVWAWFPVNA